MKVIKQTAQLTKQFKLQPDTLIFAGYCDYSQDVVIYNDDNNYALVADVGGVQKCCFKTDSEQFIASVLQQLNGRVELCGVDPFVTDFLRRSYTFVWETNCDLYVWNGKPLPHECKLKILPMSAKFAQKVSDGTHYHAAIEEVCECLRRHPSAAVYIDDEPVCWCLLHLEKSLGMLYTDVQHRHRGYALEVMTALCNKVIAQGDTPYAFIVQDNVASKNLALKYNLEFVKQADYFEIDLGKQLNCVKK